MLCLTCTMIISVDLAQYGVSCAKDWLSVDCGTILNEIWPRGYKTFFMLNSIEHEILNAHKYINIKKFGFTKAQISLECFFPAHKC